MGDQADSPAEGREGSGLQILLVRAAETPFSRQGRFEGDIDVPLTERGRRLCRRMLTEVLHPMGGVDGVYSAGNQGSRETAEILAAANSNRIRILPGLRGVSFGLWEGQLVTDVRHRHRRIFNQWQREPSSISPPEGEEMDCAIRRTHSAVRSISRKHRLGTVCVVAPGMVISLIYCHLMRIDPERVFEAAGDLSDVEVVSAEDAR